MRRCSGRTDVHYTFDKDVKRRQQGESTDGQRLHTKGATAFLVPLSLYSLHPHSA